MFYADLPTVESPALFHYAVYFVICTESGRTTITDWGNLIFTNSINFRSSSVAIGEQINWSESNLADAGKLWWKDWHENRWLNRVHSCMIKLLIGYSMNNSLTGDQIVCFPGSICTCQLEFSSMKVLKILFLGPSSQRQNANLPTLPFSETIFHTPCYISEKEPICLKLNPINLALSSVQKLHKH